MLLLAVVAGMVGLSFASVPLYRLFVPATGFGGTTQRAETAPARIAGAVDHGAVRCPDRPRPRLGISAAERAIAVHPGAQREVFFRAANRTAAPVTAQAVYNVTPAKAGIYFDKLQCFCFTKPDAWRRARAATWASSSLSIPIS